MSAALDEGRSALECRWRRAVRVSERTAVNSRSGVPACMFRCLSCRMHGGGDE